MPPYCMYSGILLHPAQSEERGQRDHELGPDERHFEPNLGDIAACCLDIDRDETLQVSAIPFQDFLTREIVSEAEIGVGEDVFMIGLFLDAAWQVGKTRNTPMARFGNISAMPTSDSLFMFGGMVFSFLGIHCGQFPERWEVERGLQRTPAEAALQIEGHHIKGLSGLTFAAPAWELAKLLQCEKFKQERARLDATQPSPIMLETKGGRGIPASAG